MAEAKDTAVFYYHTGELVMEGDHLISENGHPAVIEKIICPGTDAAADYSCPHLGLLIKEDWDGIPAYLAAPHPNGVFWEDM
jgi:hypothetical protein